MIFIFSFSLSKTCGKDNYFTNIRPDISFAMQHLSQYMQEPMNQHMSAVLHTFRYIKKNPTQGLFFNNNPSCSLLAFCDFDWAACPCTRPFVSGFYITIGGCPIAWKSRNKELFPFFQKRLNVGLWDMWLQNLLGLLGCSMNLKPHLSC